MKKHEYKPPVIDVLWIHGVSDIVTSSTEDTDQVVVPDINDDWVNQD